MKGMELYVPYFKIRDKQTLYSLNRLKGMNMADSARAAGYAESMANVANSKLEPAHNIRIKEALQIEGVTTNVLAMKIREGLEASKPDPTGPGEIVDYRERREYSKLALEAMGELKSGTTVAVQINLPTVAMDSTAWGEED